MIEPYNKVIIRTRFKLFLKRYNFWYFYIININVVKMWYIIISMYNRSILCFTFSYKLYVLGSIDNHPPTFSYIEHRITLLNSHVFDSLLSCYVRSHTETEVFLTKKAGSTILFCWDRNNRARPIKIRVRCETIDNVYCGRLNYLGRDVAHGSDN